MIIGQFRAEKRHRGEAERAATEVLEEIVDAAVQAGVDESAFGAGDSLGAVDHIVMEDGEEDEDMVIDSNQPTLQGWLANMDKFGNGIPPYPGSFNDQRGYQLLRLLLGCLCIFRFTFFDGKLLCSE